MGQLTAIDPITKIPSIRWDGKISVDTAGCWLFQGLLTEKGYGRIGKNGKRAHREMWKENFGVIREGLCVLHTCNVPRCVNPNHLYLGTDQDNHNDRVAAGTQKPPPKTGFGSEHPLYGKKHSEETRAKMRKAWEGRRARTNNDRL